MKKVKKSELFYAIARLAIDAGRGFSLEDADVHTEGRVLGGALSDSNEERRGLILRVYAPGADDEETEDEDG